MDISEILDDSTSSPFAFHGRSSKKQNLYSDQTLANVSITLAPNEMKRLLSESNAYNSVPYGQQISKAGKRIFFYNFKVVNM